MSKRKEPEDARAPSAPAADPPPPRLGDHSSYMAEPLLALADVHINVKESSALPAHAMALVQHCGALARSSELFAGASAERPAALSAPFDEYAETDVARFLKCIYTSADTTARGEDAALPAVVRLAHALDAAPVLAAAQRRWVERVPTATTWAEIAEADELAARCGWEDVRAEGAAKLVKGLQTPLGAAATPTQQALSDVDAFDYASDLIDNCAPELTARAFGTLAANFRRLRAKASAAACGSALSPAEAAAAALASADKAAIEVDGRFVVALHLPDDTDQWPMFVAPFKSHGLEWSVLLMQNGSSDNTDGRPRLGLKLRSGWPRKARYQVGLVNLRGAPLLELDAEEAVFTENAPFWHERVADLTPASFRDRAAGWVVNGCAAPFVRILEVSDATPEEAAAVDAMVE